MTERMDDGANSFWVEEINGEVQTSVRKKRKYNKTKKKEYNGWGSTSLIQFLESIGRDTSNKITQNEVTNIISDYVKQNNLLHPTKKKRVECDGRLHMLFGRKSISRLKISELLESHFADNCGQSSDDNLFDSEDDENAFVTRETPKPASSERKSQPRRPVLEKPRSCFAAINPFNIKLVYLKRSLVEQILKDPETFETKVVGSFIRIKCDPNDFLQKNSHQLLQVTGVKKTSGVDGEIRLRASGFIKDISINMLSDDNFSEVECEDLHQRVKDGLLKRPMIVDMEEKARLLHEDMTNHWLARELALLQNQIERANEKHWRKELGEYLRKRDKLQSSEEREKLLRDIPQVIADDLETESTTPDVPDKKVQNNFQDSWQATSTKTTIMTVDSKIVADGFACKSTELNEELQYLDDEEWLLHQVPLDTAGDLESYSKTPDTTDKNVENNTQELWQSSCTKESLVTDVPKAVGDGFACKATKLDTIDLTKQESDSPKSILSLSRAASDVTLFNMAVNTTMSNHISHDTAAEQQRSEVPVEQRPGQQIHLAYKGGVSKLDESNKAKIYQALPDKQVRPSQFQFTSKSTGAKISQVLLDKLVQPSPFQFKAESNEPKISQALLDKLVQPSQFQFKAESNEAKISQALLDKLVQPSQFQFKAESNEAKISQALLDKLVQPSQFQFKAESNEAKISQALLDKLVQPSQIQFIAKTNEVKISQAQPDKQVQPSQIQVIAKSNEAKISQAPPDKQVQPSQIQVIELSDDDDDENEKPSTIKQVTPEELQSSMWHYKDPHGQVQGPFPIISLKLWSDAHYFTSDFKVWKVGQSQAESVLLVDILPQFFPSG